MHDGILVQSPLPAAMGDDAAQAVFDLIDPAKDVDGFTPVNAGRLVQNRARAGPVHAVGRHRAAGAVRHPRSPAPTPSCIGRSDIVGKPMALLLLHKNATVTICHSKTKDLPRSSREADMLVAAIGRHGVRAAGW